jgi:hypothetical protein
MKADKTKLCVRCKETKSVSDYYICRTRKDGLSFYCKQCESEKKKEWYSKEQNKDKVLKHQRNYIDQNKEKLSNRWKDYREKNSEKLKLYFEEYFNKDEARAARARRCAEWRINNKEKDDRNHTKWRAENRERYIESRRAYLKTKRQNNPKFKLKCNISTGIRASINNGKNGKTWSALVGYNIDQLKNHIENLFSEGMSWDNYGEWHIDHIVPIAAFNFIRPEDEDFKRCWALENLQPLWAEDNHRKGSKLMHPFQPSLSL